MIATEHRTRLLVIALAMGLLVGIIGGVGLAVSGTFDANGDVASSSAAPVDPSEQVRKLHRAGVTGSNVSVGVVVATGVDPNSSAYAEQVVGARAFGTTATIAGDGHDDHGTATAALVSRVAPDADLVLASFDTSAGYERSMEWMRRQDVDVIVSPIAFYGRTGDGTSRVAGVAGRVGAGTVVVAPVGNVGQGHWEGTFARDGQRTRGRHRFPGGTRNYLSARDGRRLSLWLSWTGTARANLSVELYRQLGESSRLVARSSPFDADTATNEWLVNELDPAGTYYVVVNGSETANGTHFEITSPTHAFQYRTRGGSVVAPATARRVVAVGAYDPRTGSTRQFSSAGPIGDGRPGVDVVAPDGQRVVGVDGRFVGTSASSAYAAGVAALVFAANPDLGPSHVEPIFEATAADAGVDGRDPVTGSGRLVPRRAVARARNVSGR